MPETDIATPARKRLQWETAEVREIIDETPRVKSLILDVPGWSGHRAGQHVDVTHGRGWLSSPPELFHRFGTRSRTPDAHRERIKDGEVSYLVSELRPGDKFELRGPIGGYFVWTVATGGPLLLIAGGSGIAPLMAMLRHRAAVASTIPALLLYSSRSFEDIIYRDELDRLAARHDGLKVVHTLTRRQPPGWTGAAAGSIATLAGLGFSAGARPRFSFAVRHGSSDRSQTFCWSLDTSEA
jgi:ferredoxin-NADP reductase